MRQRRLTVSQKRKINKKDVVNIQLDTKCSCPQSTSDDNASIQFACRYLQCQSSMPVRVLRLFIETALPHSSMIKVSLFDSNDRLLKDSDRLRSLKHTSTSFHHIPIRFTLINTVTSLANCSCLTPTIEQNLSSSPTIIQQESIEQILSTYSFTPPKEFHSPLAIVDLLTSLPSLSNYTLDEATIGQITSEFGEICPPLPKRYCIAKQITDQFPLDLSMKTHSLSAPTKWIKT